MAATSRFPHRARHIDPETGLFSNAGADWVDLSEHDWHGAARLLQRRVRRADAGQDNGLAERD
jgi:hypothetical protein